MDDSSVSCRRWGILRGSITLFGVDSVVQPWVDELWVKFGALWPLDLLLEMTSRIKFLGKNLMWHRMLHQFL